MHIVIVSIIKVLIASYIKLITSKQSIELQFTNEAILQGLLPPGLSAL